MRRVYQSLFRTIWISHWDADLNVHEPGYNAGHFPPHYPVPAIPVYPLQTFGQWKNVNNWLFSFRLHTDLKE